MSTKGQKMNSAQFTQLIREAVAGTYDPAGERFILVGLKGEWVPEESWANFRPDGVNEDLWNAISKEHRLLQGTIQWDFNDIPVLLEMWAGAGAVVTPVDEEDFVRFLHGLPPHGARNLVTFSLERGERDDCERCTYALLLSIDLEADRDGERVGGNFTILCRAPIATGVAMTGSAAVNTIYEFTAAAGTTAPLVLGVAVPGNGTQAVTVNPWDTEEEIEAAFAAAANIGAATAVKDIAQVAKVFGLAVPEADDGPYTIAGSGNVTTAQNAAAWQAALRLRPGFEDAVVAGTITPPGNAGDLAAGKNGVAFGDPVAEGVITDVTDGNHSTKVKLSPGAGNGVTIDLTTAQLIDKVTAYWCVEAGGANVTMHVKTSPTGAFAGEETDWGTQVSNQNSSDYVAAAIDFTHAAVSARYIRIYNEDDYGNNTWLFTVEAKNTDPAPGEIDITVTIPVTSSNPNIAAPAATGTGANGTLPILTPYAASGTIEVEITDPEQVLVTMSKTSGTGWSLLRTQAGTDGTIRIPPRKPLMPQMFTLRQADTRAGLAAAPAIDLVKLVRFGFDNLVNPEWFAEENVLTYQSHTDGEAPTRTIGFRLSKNSTYAAGTLADSREQPSKPRWREIRFVHPDALHKFQIQMLASPSGAAPIQAAGNIRAYEFPLGVVLDDLALEYDGPESEGASVYMIAQVAV